MGKKSKKQKKQAPQTPITRSKSEFSCFICFDDFKKFEDGKQAFTQHETLKTIQCLDCNRDHLGDDGGWHSTGDFLDKDEDGKFGYCEICADGGDMVSCDEKACSLSYCLKCLPKWLGKRAYNELVDEKNEDEHFTCFICIEDDQVTEKFPVYTKLLDHSTRYNKEAELFQFQAIIDELDDGKKIKKYTCFSCFDPVLRMTAKKMPEKHKDLGVAICVQCHTDLYDKGEFTYTNGKMDYCCVTAEGGNVISCDKCERSYSEETLRKWIGDKDVDILLEDDDSEFICFKCNPKLGRYQMFLEHTELFDKAFDAEFEVYIKPKAKRAKRSSPQRTTSSRGAKRKAESSESESSDDEMELQLRDRNEKRTYDEVSDVESTASDYVTPDKKETKVTKEDIKNYWTKKITERVPEKYQDDKYHKTLLAALKKISK